MEYKISNRKPNFRDIQLVLTKNNLGSIDKKFIDRLIEVFTRLRDSGKDMSNQNELSEVASIVKKEHLARTRVLTKDEKAGYVAVGTLTTIGTIILTILIFTIIQNIIMN